MHQNPRILHKLGLLVLAWALGGVAALLTPACRGPVTPALIATTLKAGVEAAELVATVLRERGELEPGDAERLERATETISAAREALEEGREAKCRLELRDALRVLLAIFEKQDSDRAQHFPPEVFAALALAEHAARP